MTLRERIGEAVESGKPEFAAAVVAESPGALRYLAGYVYDSDEARRACAARAIALCAATSPQPVEELVRRLAWAMNDESGTNAVTAPEVVQAIAAEHPEVLLPLLPDLMRLCADERLRPGLGVALKLVAEKLPGRVLPELQKELQEKVASGCPHPSRRPRDPTTGRIRG